MQKILKSAVIQLNSKDNLEENLAAAEKLLDKAGGLGADFAALPECWTYSGNYDGAKKAAQSLSGGAIKMLQRKARQYKMIIHGGSIHESHPDLKDKVYNTSVLINRLGEVSGIYRKVHLFEGNFTNGVRYDESELMAPGDKIVTAAVDGITFGMSICYDLRFPELYRTMALKGAQIIVVSSAFATHTGRDHWEVLLRARAIENFCYIAAPNQVGESRPGKPCYGRSMIIDPWGVVVAQASDKPTVIMAEIDLNDIEKAHAQIPCLRSRKPHVYKL